jgi:hypothetical protein
MHGSCSRSVELSDDRSIRNENEQSSPTVHVTSAGSESVGSKRLGRIMRWHECLRIPSDPSHYVMMDKVHLFLIAPYWPSQAWFPTLLELLTDHPRRLRVWDHLLWHPLGRGYHNSPSFYNLHAWKFSAAQNMM